MLLLLYAYFVVSGLLRLALTLSQITELGLLICSVIFLALGREDLDVLSKDTLLDFLTLGVVGVGAIASLILRLYDQTRNWEAVYAACSFCIWATQAIRFSTHNKAPLLFSILFLGALLCIVATPWPINPEKSPNHPVTKSPFIATVTLSWLDPLLRRASLGTLSDNDLWGLDQQLSVSREREDTLQTRDWSSAVTAALRKGVIVMLLRAAPSRFIFSGMLAFINLFMVFTQPFMLRNLLDQRNAQSVAGLFLVTAIAGLAEAHAKFALRVTGIRVRAALSVLLCEHGMNTVGRKTRLNEPEPSILIEVDTLRIYEFAEIFHNLWMMPVQVCVSLGALIYMLGWKSVALGSIAPVSGSTLHLSPA